MGQDMKDIGRTIKLMAKADLYTLMVMYMRETGRMIKPMAKESTLM